MNVKELIEELQEMPQDAEVNIGKYYNPCESVVLDNDSNQVIIE